MKKIITIIALAAISMNVNAQAVPNGGFENWTHHAAGIVAAAYDEPVGWHTLDSTIANTLLGVITSFKATAAGEYHNGSAAIKLVTQSVGGQTANGIATTGTINTTTFTIGGGNPYTGRPDSIVGFYRAAPSGVDSGFVELQLLGAGGATDTVGYARFKTTRNAITTFTRFSKAINYRNSNAVVTALWIMSASADATTHNVGSTIWIDDLGTANASGLRVSEQSKPDVAVYPNPATNYLQINNAAATKAIITLFDVTGRKVVTQSLVNTLNTVDVAELHSGLYIYSITDENNKVIKTGKVTIQK